MTKARPEKQTEKAARRPRIASTAPKGDDACELLLAELQARRVRLRKLLQMVWTEAAHLPAGPPAGLRAKCANTHVQHTA
jgi:hypothetical protein